MSPLSPSSPMLCRAAAIDIYTARLDNTLGDQGIRMPELTFQVLDGVDRGRVFRNLPTPITIGREEGNMLRLNDERVSRYHAKVQFDNEDVILTDLDSTNGTRINGNPVQIRRLRPGDRVGVEIGRASCRERG